MQVQFEDKEYSFDMDDIDLRQARAIKRMTGLTLKKFGDGLSEADPDAVAAAYWLMLSQNGIAVDINKLNFNVVKFLDAIGDAGDRERADELGITVEELHELSAEAVKSGVTVESLVQATHGNPTKEASAEPATT